MVTLWELPHFSMEKVDGKLETIARKTNMVPIGKHRICIVFVSQALAWSPSLGLEFTARSCHGCDASKNHAPQEAANGRTSFPGSPAPIGGHMGGAWFLAAMKPGLLFLP